MALEAQSQSCLCNNYHIIIVDVEAVVVFTIQGRIQCSQIKNKERTLLPNIIQRKLPYGKLNIKLCIIK